MRTITVTYGPEDAWAFTQAHLSPHAWAAIDDAINNIRNHFKHESTTMEQCLHDVLHILADAKARLDE